MSLTSIDFYLFFLISLLVYYLLPIKIRWIGIFVCSIAFILCSSKPMLILYTLFQVVATWFCTIKITESISEENVRKSKIYMLLGLISNLAILAVLKYSNFFIDNLNLGLRIVGKGGNFNRLNLLVPLGISFYTLQLIGYILDVYWGIVESEKNLFKVATFGMFYNQIISGPISRYAQLSEQLFAAHKFSYKQLTFGLQRMLWGIFKKLVIASRIGIVVDTIYANDTYSGLYIWIAAGLYVLQLYADFSGCMDIVIGAAECYGITMEENFKTPLFAKTVQEYWQRWHITLGTWLKDYILYPILRTNLFRNVAKSLKKKGKKKLAGQLTSYMGMLVVWLLVGLWHGGGWKYILGQGMWFYACIVLEQLTEPVLIKICNKLHFNRDCFSFHLGQSIKVFILSSIGNMFFRLDGFGIVISKIKMGLSYFNPWIFVDGSLYKLGVDEKDFSVMIYAMFAFLIVSIMQEKVGCVREWIAKQNIVFRYIIWIILLMSVLLFGYYGPNYDAASFIYQGF